MRDRMWRLRRRYLWHRKKGHRAPKLRRAYQRAKTAWLRARRAHRPSNKAWGGSQAVAESCAHLAGRYGAWISSRKRAASHPLSRKNPGSDHNTANRTAYAIDFATRNGAPLAHAIARELGIGNYRTGTYTFYYVQRNNRTFRVQILWAVSGHYDHVHLGVRAV